MKTNKVVEVIDGDYVFEGPTKLDLRLHDVMDKIALIGVRLFPDSDVDDLVCDIECNMRNFGDMTLCDKCRYGECFGKRSCSTLRPIKEMIQNAIECVKNYIRMIRE